jgi:hypothetical protein
MHIEKLYTHIYIYMYIQTHDPKKIRIFVIHCCFNHLINQYLFLKNIKLVVLH